MIVFVRRYGDEIRTDSGRIFASAAQLFCSFDCVGPRDSQRDIASVLMSVFVARQSAEDKCISLDMWGSRVRLLGVMVLLSSSSAEARAAEGQHKKWRDFNEPLVEIDRLAPG